MNIKYLQVMLHSMRF